MKELLTIEWIRVRRNMGEFFLTIGLPVLFFLIFSTSVSLDDVILQKAFVQSYMLTMTSFSMSGFALFTFPMMLQEDRSNHWIAFLKHSPLSMRDYYLANLVRTYFCFGCSILAVFAVDRWGRGVEMLGSRWMFSAVLLLLSAAVFLAIGLILAQIRSQQTMTIYANLIYFVLAIFGGSWMPISVFPDWVQSICKVLPSYHVNQLVTTYAQEGTILWKSLLIQLIYAIIFIRLALTMTKKGDPA